MTNETLQIVVNAICLEKGEDLNGFELNVIDLESMPITYKVFVTHDNISNITLPYEYIRKVHKEREKAKIIIELINQIIQNGDEWLQQEKDYWQDRKENEEENKFESNRDYKD